MANGRRAYVPQGKFTAEELCKHYGRERGLSVTIFRFWGAFGKSIGGRHLRDLIRKAMKHEPLEMVQGAGGAFLTMADLGRAMMSAAAQPVTAGQVYNLGSLFSTWEEIGKMIGSLTHSNSAICLIPADEWRGPAFLNEVWDLSWEKAERDFGFRPDQSTEGLRTQLTGALQECVGQVREAGSPLFAPPALR